MSKTFLPVRGCKDFLPKEASKRNLMQKIIFDNFKKAGFLKIETPFLEKLNFLLKSDGGDDLQLIFKILKRGEKLKLPANSEYDLSDIGLRYDLTVPLSRYYLNNKSTLPKVFKSIQIGDVFRAERPQKGRNRQFTQCDIDIVGEESSKAEIELLITSGTTLLALGFNNFVFKISDRKILNKLIEQAGFSKENFNDIAQTLDKIGKIKKEGILEELKIKKYEEKVIKKLLSILDDVSKNKFKALEKYNIEKKYIDGLKEIVDSVSSFNDDFKVEFDIYIVRGQGYYTSTIYELYLKKESYALGGGGRYDDMIGKEDKEKTPAVGFSFGFERLFLLAKDDILNKENKNIVLFFNKEDKFLEVLRYKENLINKNMDVHIAKKSKNFPFQLKTFKSLGYDNYVEFSNEEIIKIKGEKSNE